MWGTRRESQQQQGVRGLPGKTERHWRQFPKSKLCQVESVWYPGASISWLMLLVAQAAAPGTAWQSGEHSQDSWVCGSTRWMVLRPGRCFFWGSFLKVGEGWSQFKTEPYLQVAESPIRGGAFLALPLFPCELFNSHLISASALVLLPASSLTSDFPLLPAARYLTPVPPTLCWAEVSGGRQGEQKDGVGLVTSAPRTCWCSQVFWTCFVLVMSPFSPVLLQNGNTKTKTGFGNRWLGEENKKDGSAAHGTAVHCCSASLLAPWTQPGFYIVSQSPCKGIDVWVLAR